jgi:hypothetical protein
LNKSQNNFSFTQLELMWNLKVWCLRKIQSVRSSNITQCSGSQRSTQPCEVLSLTLWQFSSCYDYESTVLKVKHNCFDVHHQCGQHDSHVCCQLTLSDLLWFTSLRRSDVDFNESSDDKISSCLQQWAISSLCKETEHFHYWITILMTIWRRGLWHAMPLWFLDKTNKHLAVNCVLRSA